MSMFGWLFRKPALTAPQPSHSGLAALDATVPYVRPGSKANAGSTSQPLNSAGDRKGERLERRELLYAVVRESMTRAGLLSTSYKFKVLSLDARGRQYLIMMDMAQQNLTDQQRLADMEGYIAKVAKARHDIMVTAVYWRENAQVTAELAQVAPAARSKAPMARYEPLQPDEVTAFKEALVAAAPSSRAAAAPGELVRSGRRNPAPPSFQDTRQDEHQSPLSGTQYGDL